MPQQKATIACIRTDNIASAQPEANPTSWKNKQCIRDSSEKPYLQTLELCWLQAASSLHCVRSAELSCRGVCGKQEVACATLWLQCSAMQASVEALGAALAHKRGRRPYALWLG